MTSSICFFLSNSFSCKAILLKSKGSPWAVRWFFVRPSMSYASSRASEESLNRAQTFYIAAPTPLESKISDGSKCSKLLEAPEEMTAKDVHVEMTANVSAPAKCPFSSSKVTSSPKISSGFTKNEAILVALIAVVIGLVLGHSVSKF